MDHLIRSACESTALLGAFCALKTHIIGTNSALIFKSGDVCGKTLSQFLFQL